MGSQELTIPMVEIFETVEGEGMQAGFPTTFIRVFHCNLRCSWCDTPYSYAPEKPVFSATISEIVDQVREKPNPAICLTGGEPLIHGKRSEHLIEQLAVLDFVEDLHIETNGAIDLAPFAEQRQQNQALQSKVRFILDYKLPASGEQDKMMLSNFDHLMEQDEVKFVIADQQDFAIAKHVVEHTMQRGISLFSPVWGQLEPAELTQWILQAGLRKTRLNLQIHKYIWHPDARGV